LCVLVCVCVCVCVCLCLYVCCVCAWGERCMRADTHRRHAQIVNERFLVYINELLASGFIPEIFNTEELDSIFQGLRAAAKAAAIGESREAMREFFGRRVRANLHVVLCFSPVGDHFRIRARRFPALINCTQIDWCVCCLHIRAR
jgi:hypothetical protein